MMGKVQAFFRRHQRALLALLTGLLLVAEAGRLAGQPLVYRVAMALGALVGGLPLLVRALAALRYRVIGIELLVTIAIVGATVIGEYNEAAIVSWLFILGDQLEAWTLTKTRAAVKALTDLAPQTALVVASPTDPTGELMDIDFVAPGDLVLVKTGDRIPVDGVVVSGRGLVNAASLTGEAAPLRVTAEKEVAAGTLLTDGQLVVKTSRVGEATAFGKIINLVEEAQDKKSRAQKVIDRFARYYTPLVLVLALLVGLVSGNARLAITVLVLGCPGALVIGVPVSTVAGIGRAARLGVLVKSSASLTALTRVDTVIFDKTGTLTLGQPTVVNQWWAPRVPAGTRELLVGVETVASHPLATAVRAAFPGVSGRAVSESRVVRGRGIVAVADGHRVLVGNAAHLADHAVDAAAVTATAQKWAAAGQSLVYLAVDERLVALLGITDPLRPEAVAMVTRLRSQGVSQLVLLSGDQPEVVARVGKALGLDRAEGGLLPEDKVRILKEYEEGGHSVAFVGDGINDSPSLATATVGVAMGQGTAVAVDVSDLILLRSDLNKLPQARWLAKHLRANMVENIAIALLTVLLLFAGLFAGWVGMASGMLVHELSILVVIVNGMRLLKINPHN